MNIEARAKLKLILQETFELYEAEKNLNSFIFLYKKLPNKLGESQFLINKSALREEIIKIKEKIQKEREKLDLTWLEFIKNV